MYFNQNHFADILYTNGLQPNATIKTDGACPVAIAMALTEIGVKTDPIEIAKLSIRCNARLPVGTDISLLCKCVAQKYSEDIVITSINDIGLLKAALLRGAKAVACINGGGSKGCYQSIIAQSPHFVTLVEIDGNTVLLWDPDSREGKYPFHMSQNTPFPDVRMDVSLIHKETDGFTPRYFVFDGPESIENLPL